MKADQAKTLRLLKTARGQLDGLIKMVEEDRYCIDISNQLLATQAILHKINKDVLNAHLQSCVSDALGALDDKDKKINEIITIIDKLAK